MELSVAALTDVGRVRTNNEDSYFADRDLGLFVVCDGMGGHNAGEVASQATCDVLLREIEGASRVRERFLATGSPEDAEALRRLLDGAMNPASREIFKRAAKEPELAGMGTTCTAMLVIGHHKALAAQVGDSRLYVHRAGRIRQLTDDHTYVNELVRRGSLTRDQARGHPQGNVLSRAMGVQPWVAADTMLFDLDPDDTYLLCSDGLHNYFPDAQQLLPGLVSPDLALGAHALVREALDRGGHDNATAILVRVGGDAIGASATAERRILALKRAPLFRQLGYNEVVRVVGQTTVAHAAPGQVVAREGDAGTELYVVLAGELEVEKGGRAAGTLGPGAHFGELALTDPSSRSTTVRARSAVTLLVLRRPELIALVRSDPVIASKILWSFVVALSGRVPDAADADDFEVELDG